VYSLSAMSWAQTVTKNLLPLSVADTLQGAMREWSATGDCEIREEADGTCELCEHEDIRYEFEINNDLNGNQMTAVGSTCITKFIRLYDGDQEIIGEANKGAYLAKRRQEAIDGLRKDKAWSVLLAIQQREPAFPAQNLHLSWDKGHTIKQLWWILSKGRHFGIPVDLSLFNASLRKERYREQVNDLPPWKYAKIRPAFSPAQRAKYDAPCGWKGK
jgi:hypothetical protein